jgi:hypothetical protein
MPGREEVLRSLYGAWRLARLDRAGMTHFNLTIEGFWRSFFAAVLVAPGYAILVAQKLAERSEVVPEDLPSAAATQTADLGWVLLVQTLAYLIGWAAFPLAAAVLTWFLNLGRNYVALIVAANWAAVIQIGLFLSALVLTFVLPGPLAGLLVTAVTVSILFYQWFVTRTALETTGGIALALVLVDLLLNTVINLSAERLL